MENKNSYTIVGIFFVTCLALIAFFVIWMSSKTNPEDSYTNYYIQTKELPSGIKEGTAVKFVGLPAGVVKDIYFSDLSKGIIRIVLSVRSVFPINKNSQAEIQSAGLTSLPTINILKGTGAVYSEDDKDKEITLKATLLQKVTSKAETIGERLSEITSKIEKILSDKNIQNIDNTIASISEFSKKLTDETRLKKVDELIASVTEITKNIDNNKPKFNALLDKTNTFVTSATKTINNFDKSQAIIRQSLKNGDYNFKEILSPTLFEAKKTLFEFSKILREFQNTLIRLQNDPYNFFFKDTQGKQK